MDKILHDPKDPKLLYGNYGIFLIMSNAGFCPSTVSLKVRVVEEFVKGFFPAQCFIGSNVPLLQTFL